MADDQFSMFEIRCRAPLHYEARAKNARYVAYCLNQSCDDGWNEKAAEAIGYTGTPDIAKGESFLREASLSIELILKAVVARKIQLGKAPAHLKSVPMTHDVIRLWQAAGLPKVSDEDWHRLVRIKQILFWAGRYAAPVKDEHFKKEVAEFDMRPLPSVSKSKRIRIYRPPALDWENFDRLFQIASKELSSMDGLLY